MDQPVPYMTPVLECHSLLVEWRNAELKICSASAGELAGAPFPKPEVRLIGFCLEYQRFGSEVHIICKHLLSTSGDGQDGKREQFWHVCYRLRLRREGVYKLEARRGRLVSDEVLKRHYDRVGEEGLYIPR